jgi:DNA-binding MarR family transcriptional regulator
VTPPDEQTPNLLGALALVVTEQAWDEIAAACGQAGSDAAALSALHQFLDHPTLDRLRHVLGLTPSGAVRLVDRLAAAGLVVRGPGGDGRSRSVTLTAKGRRTAARIAGARLAYLSGLLTSLSAEESRVLSSVISKIMSEVVNAKDGGAWICRLCDLPACGRAECRCPTANAAALKYAAHPG